MKDGISLGVCAWSLPAEGLDTIRICSEMGFEGMVLDFGRPQQDYPLSDESLIRTYQQEALTYGVKLETLALNVFNHLRMIDRNNQLDACAIFTKAVHTARLFGMKVLQVPSFGKGIILTRDDLLKTAGCLRTLCDEAADAGMKVVSENALTAEENMMLVEAVDRENFRLCFDTANPYLLGDSLDGPGVLRGILPYVEEVHMKDLVKDEPEGFHYVQLGSGEVRLSESISLLREYAYSGWVHLENIYEEAYLAEDRKILEEAFGLS